MLRAASLLALPLLAAGCASAVRVTPAEYTHDGIAIRRQVVMPVAETDPVPSIEDAADDAAIWHHPTDRAKDLIIGTDKQNGLEVYGIAGKRLMMEPRGRVNNVDIRQGVQLGGRTLDIVATENRTDNSLAVYSIGTSNGQPALQYLVNGSILPGLEVYGSAVYHSAKDGKLYSFVGSKAGRVVQMELVAMGDGSVGGRIVRTLQLPSQVEGIVADDFHGVVYIGEEARGVWKFGAEPDAPAAGELIIAISPAGPITIPDVEGLTIYETAPGEGYLIVSNQEENEYEIFERNAPHAHLLTVATEDGAAADGSQETDGIAATSKPFGPYPAGVLVVQDGFNDDGNQNFKIVDWRDVAAGL